MATKPPSASLRGVESEWKRMSETRRCCNIHCHEIIERSKVFCIDCWRALPNGVKFGIYHKGQAGRATAANCMRWLAEHTKPEPEVAR